MKHAAQKILTIQQNLYDFLLNKITNENHVNPTESQVRGWASQYFFTENILLPQKNISEIIDQITFSIIGLGPLEFLIRDDEVSEIMVNGPQHIFIEKQGQLVKSNQYFLDDQHLLNVINRIVGQVGRRIDESTPLVDARLLDGSRVNVVIPPLAISGPILTIRKFPKKAFKIEDMIAKKSLSPAMFEFLKTAVKNKENILISGGTGAGKTSTLNACASMINREERLITIEDAAEIRIDHPHLISLEARNSNIEGKGAITIRDLLKNALRMRPDRIVVGEIRGGEAIDMLQAMNTGHKGSLTTIHANSPLESLFRLETMVLMGDVDLPISAIRPQIISGIDVVVQQQRLSDGSRKITKISKIIKDLGINTKYEVQDLFSFESEKQVFITH